jgi:valyl-tRNA synthetase
MGWPDDTPTLRRFYPTDVLITAGDIIFFWVARMVMAGYEFMGDRPFHTVFFNSVVRDLQGRKMSKSLGNSPDPIEVMDEYGADALRFTVVASAPPGEDLRFAKEKTELGRNFANKIWNAARFALRSAAGPIRPPAEQRLSLADRWILSRLERVTRESARALEELRFNEGAMHLYRFIWGEFCDWYLEMSKLALYGSDGVAAEAAQSTLLHALERLMRLLHPYMPFLSEEIWQALPLDKPVLSIMVASYPDSDENRVDSGAEQRVDVLIELVRAVRNIRSELGLPPAAEVQVRIRGEGDANALADIEPYFRVLAKVSAVEHIAAGLRPAGEPSAIVAGVGEVYVPLRGVVDLGEVRSRIERDLRRVEKELSAVAGKLGRPDFVERAPAEVVEKERQRSGQLTERRAALARHLETLGAAS